LEVKIVFINLINKNKILTKKIGYKQSGFGRELGEYGLHEYTEVKNVTIRLSK
jgi:acyl-CoA reductase-like NAD-dependent aldehyde dehydrogenase